MLPYQRNYWKYQICIERDLGTDLNEDDWNKAINSVNSSFICNGLRENILTFFIGTYIFNIKEIQLPGFSIVQTI